MPLDTDRTVADTRHFKSYVNNLASILALPAMWAGLECSQVATTLLDALVRTLRLDMAYLRATVAEGSAPQEWIRSAAESANGTNEPVEACPALAAHVTTRRPGASSRIENPCGAGMVSIVGFELRLEGAAIGTCVAGSRRLDFPTDGERLLLQVAINQAAVALQAAQRPAREALWNEVAEWRRMAQALSEMALPGDEQARPVHANGTCTDAADRKPAPDGPRQVFTEIRTMKKRLQRENSQQAGLLNLTHDTIFVRNMQDVITYWNRGAEELYGWTAGQAIGKDAHQLLKTIFPIPIEELRIELLRAGRWEGELQTMKADGTRVTVASRWSIRRDEQGRLDAILETNNDVSDRKRRDARTQALNEELKKRSAELETINRELEAFSYSVSHDLRAPLRHIVGYGEMLQKHSGSLLDQEGSRFMTAILNAARRMGNLIDDLLAFSRIARADTQMTMVDLNRLLKEVVEELQPDTHGRDIAWRLAALPVVHGDRSMLRLALVNLLSNAVKFTRTRPRAEIEVGCTEGTDDTVVVFVRDNGVGFNMKYADKLFRVFQRLHQQEAFEGSGIGLATVRRIISRHSGSVWAEGRKDDGAVFYFSVPRRSERPTHA
jgi:PAS domain S-box-containing protein